MGFNSGISKQANDNNSKSKPKKTNQLSLADETKTGLPTCFFPNTKYTKNKLTKSENEIEETNISTSHQKINLVIN